MSYYVYSLTTDRVIAYARTIEEAMALAYGEEGSDLDVAEMDHEEADAEFWDEMPF